MIRRTTLLRLALPLSACALSVGFATTGACRLTTTEPPPIPDGRYVLITGGTLPVIPGTFTDSAGRTQRMLADTLDIVVGTGRYTERGSVALINADGSAQPAQSFVIGPRSFNRINNFSFDLPSTIVGPARVQDGGEAGSPLRRQILLTKLSLTWIYSQR